MISRHYWDDEHTIETIGRAIQDGKLVISTTDTVIGLLAGATKKGKNSLDLAKNRVEKPYLLLVVDIEKALGYVHPDERVQIENIGRVCWPGPVTLVARAAPGLPDYLLSSEGTIALRVPAHSGLQRLLGHVDVLFSTSANTAGAPVPELLKDLDSSFLKKAVAIVADRKEDKKTVPSTIINCSTDPVSIVRKGAFAVELLKPIIGYIPR